MGPGAAGESGTPGGPKERSASTCWVSQLLPAPGRCPCGAVRSPVRRVHGPVRAPNATVAAVVIVLQRRLPRHLLDHHPELDQVPAGQGHCGEGGQGPADLSGPWPLQPASLTSLKSESRHRLIVQPTSPRTLLPTTMMLISNNIPTPPSPPPSLVFNAPGAPPTLLPHLQNTSHSASCSPPTAPQMSPGGS